jgi:hypothetical protein
MTESPTAAAGRDSAAEAEAEVDTSKTMSARSVAATRCLI